MRVRGLYYRRGTDRRMGDRKNHEGLWLRRADRYTPRHRGSDHRQPGSGPFRCLHEQWPDSRYLGGNRRGRYPGILGPPDQAWVIGQTLASLFPL
jgi:hypothetical protein